MNHPLQQAITTSFDLAACMPPLKIWGEFQKEKKRGGKVLGDTGVLCALPCPSPDSTVQVAWNHESAGAQTTHR